MNRILIFPWAYDTNPSPNHRGSLKSSPRNHGSQRFFLVPKPEKKRGNPKKYGVFVELPQKDKFPKCKNLSPWFFFAHVLAS